MMRHLAVCVGGLVVAVRLGVAAEAPNNLVATDAAAAGPDFAVQGEYLGTLTIDGSPERVGVQVIALGGGQFRLIGCGGGLPGEGWNGYDTDEAAGKTEAGVTRFASETRTGLVQDGKLIVSARGEGEIGALNRVERKSPTLGARPPAGAVVLFDGSSAAAFEGKGMTDDGLLREGQTSREKFQSCRVHLEFQTPFMPDARGQERGNSGCYLQGRYEVQILDSFGLKGTHDECGGIYSVGPPRVNMCYPPLSWQTYDITFTAAQFDPAGNKVKNAKMTVLHNGVLVHRDVEIDHTTTAAPNDKEGADPGPLFLQDHGSPVRYRNIWVVPQEAP